MGGKDRAKDKGWVNVSVQTYQSQRNAAQRILQQDYTVDESGATLNALARNSDGRDQEQTEELTTGQGGSTSILLRDWKFSGRRAFIRYDREDNNFWFSPVIDENRAVSSTPGFPCSRGDVFLKVGMRGARLIPWRLQEGDIFRLGQAYVLVSKIRFEDDAETHAQLLQEVEAAEPDPEEGDTDVDESLDADSQRPQCYICYDPGCKGNPLLNLCQCAGTVKYVHLQCLQRWMQPEGSSAVNTHCPICKSKYPESAQAMMINSPAIMLESWSNHRTLKLRHWISFNRHSTAALGRFSEHNDVSIPDHSVSGEHAFIIHQNGQFWLHDRDSSNGTFIRLRAPLRLAFGESLQMKMGKSLLSLHAKRTRWSRLRSKLLSLSFSSDPRAEHEAERAERLQRETVAEAAERASLESFGALSHDDSSLGDASAAPTPVRERSRVLTMPADD